MHDWYDELRARGPRDDAVRIPAIWLAVALSLLIHVALLWKWLPDLRMASLEAPKRGEGSTSLSVQLAPPPRPSASAPPSRPSASAPPTKPSSTTAQARPAPPRQEAQRKPAARPPSAPAVIARKEPAPNATTVPATPSLPAPQPSPPAVSGDLASYIEAQRRARGEPATVASAANPSDAPPIESERERHNRMVAANLGLNRTPSFGRDQQAQGGGIFQIQRMGYDEAEFLFFGWNKDIRRNSKQLIEVRRGSEGDIRIAVVRRMIAIIREHESGDFVWVSERLGRHVTLSARPSDNLGLEEFMLQEFFETPRR